MNNNFYEIPNEWYGEFNDTFVNQMNMSNNNANGNLTDPKTALERGNLFNNLYDPYRNYKYRELRASNRREEILYSILAHNFVLTELNLYLDINPTDRSALNLYNKYLNDKNNLIKEYENNFGPLTLSGLNMGNNNFNWVNVWPWEGSK